MTIDCAYDQLVRVVDLKPHPKNPNTHSAAQIAAIAAVIEGNGWRAPITVSNRSGFNTRGHGRLEAATLLGCEQVPVDFQDYASEQAELSDMLADNHLAELAEMDEDRLVGVLKELQAAGHDVGLAGFTEDEIARLTAVEDEIAQLEPIPKMELQATAAARRGHAFWDHSATLGIRTCCGWSFGQYVFSALPTTCGIVPALVAGRAQFWSAAGSEAPRRFGFGARARPELCVNTGAGRKSKAPSPLRSAGALQNLNAGALNTYFGHSRGPVVVPRCARHRRQGKEFLVSTIRPHANSFDSRLPENALPAMLRTKF